MCVTLTFLIHALHVGIPVRFLMDAPTSVAFYIGPMCNSNAAATIHIH